MSLLTGSDQLSLFHQYVNDPRGRIATGFIEIDRLLRRGGLAPGELVILGGRTRTRKTTVMMNMIVNMLSVGIGVGLVGLDEAKHNYISKLLSVVARTSPDHVEEAWPNVGLETKYEQLSPRFALFDGYRPNMSDLSLWLQECEIRQSHRPEVVFIDYSSLLARAKYDGSEVQRIPRLVEAIKVWTNQEEVVTVALHQVGRLDEGTGLRYHGATPMTLEGLRYGGEEVADIVLSTYRPSLDPVGNMRWDMARKFKGDKFEYEDWLEAKNQVDHYRDYTFLQLLKNRPGTHTDEQGTPLRSIGESMAMEVDTSIIQPSQDEVRYGEVEQAGGTDTPPHYAPRDEGSVEGRPQQEAGVRRPLQGFGALGGDRDS